jgi:hypothetical protein
VSSDAAETQLNGAEMQRLESALQRLLSAFEALERRAGQAEARVKQLEGAMRTSATPGGDLDPVALANRVSLLEQENRFLARRLDRARESVRRISARLQFLDEDK